MTTRAEIEKLIADFEVCKKEYAMPNSDVDSGELFNHAWKMGDAITHLLTKIDALREALNFYQNILNYMAELKDGGFDYKRTPLHVDFGDTAREALAQTEHLKR